MRNLNDQQGAALRAVKDHFGVRHAYFDGWYTNFLENKDFDVAETIAKLKRRHAMEREEFAKYDVTEAMLKSMRSGVLQLLPGRDCDGMPVVYIVTRRDHPKAEERELRTKNLDMWLTYVTRLCELNMACKVTWLINQKGSSLWSNTDLTFQRTILTRIAKYFPNCQHRLYVCNMSNSLSFVLKPLIHGAPRAISESIVIISEADVKARKLLQYFDASVLPLELGGEADVDHPSSWERFSNEVTAYTQELVAVLRRGVHDVKTFEMMQAFGTDAAGQPIRDATTPASALLGDTRGTLDATIASNSFASTSTSQEQKPAAQNRHPASTASVRNVRLHVPIHAMAVEPVSTTPQNDMSSLSTSSSSDVPFAALNRSNHAWLQCQADARYQHRSATVAIMWLRMVETAASLGPVVDLLSAAAKVRASKMDAPTNARATDELQSVGCSCCGLPAHHVALLCGATGLLEQCARNALQLWRSMGRGDEKRWGVAAEGCGSVLHLLSWALGGGASLQTTEVDAAARKTTREHDGLLTLTCLLTAVDVYGRVPSLAIRNSNASPVVHAAPLHNDASEFFDTMRLLVARSFDALGLLHRALQAYHSVALRVLRVWVPGVPRDALQHQFERKAERQWSHRLVPLIAAYEAHQAAIAILQYILREATKKRHHEQPCSRMPSVGQERMYGGARNAVYLGAHSILLARRRLERRSHLFHVFPHWSKVDEEVKEEVPGAAKTLASWLTLGMGTIRSAIPPQVWRAVNETGAHVLGKLLPTPPVATAADGLHEPASWSLIAPAAPSLASIVGAYRRRSACQQAPQPSEDGNSRAPDWANFEHHGPDSAPQPHIPQLLALIADVDNILHDATEGANTIRRQLEDNHYRAAHLVARHGCTTMLHNAIWAHGTHQPPLLATTDCTSAENSSEADVPLDVLLREEQLGMLRVVADLPYAIGEFLFALAAQTVLSQHVRLDVAEPTPLHGHCSPLPENPQDWQRHVWSHEATMQAWDPRVQQAQQLLEALSHVLQQLSLSSDGQNRPGLGDGHDAFAELVRTAMPSSSPAATAVRSMEDMVLRCAQSVASMRLHQQRQDDIANDTVRAETMAWDTSTQRMPPVFANDSVVKALLTAEAFQASMQEVCTVATVY